MAAVESYYFFKVSHIEYVAKIIDLIMSTICQN